MPSIRVLIADDHPLWRKGVSDYLSSAPDVDIVAEANDGQEALDLLRSTPLDVALIDMEMPLISGVEVARRASAEGLDVRILALSSYDDEDYVNGLLEVGAAGYITKGMLPASILEAVRAVAQGQGRWFVNPARSAPAGACGDLSPREREVLALVAQGLTNAEVAERLFISAHTVRNHLSRCFNKLGFTTAREAIAWAWQNGLGAQKPQ